VISILWSVDDETSKQLIVAFYEEMLRDGKDPAEALRRSQLRIMQQPHKSAPFYWAGFVITSAGS
jgi:CHAT domain-containing protein